MLNRTTPMADMFYESRNATTSSAESIDAIAGREQFTKIFNTITSPTITNAATMELASIALPINVTEVPYVPYEMRPETYIVPLLLALIFIVGVVGNGLLIIVFLTVRQMRNAPNTFIFSLAIADLIVIITTVPLTSTIYTMDSWPWGVVLCRLSEFCKDVSIGVSVFTLIVLSGDRYFAIVHPLRKFHSCGGGRAQRFTIKIIALIWALAILCGLPALFSTYIKFISIKRNKTLAICYPFPENWGIIYAKMIVMIRFVIYYATPLIIITVFHTLIARHLMHAAANIPGELQGAAHQVRTRRKVAITVVAFVLIFGICFLPMHIFMLWFYYWPTAQHDYNTFWHILRIVAFCLTFANSCANPIALYFVSDTYRKHFNRYLFCKWSYCGRNSTEKNAICMKRNSSVTSQRRLSRQQQSTIRSWMQESTTTTIVIANVRPIDLNDIGTMSTRRQDNVMNGGNNITLKSNDNCHQKNHEHYFV